MASYIDAAAIISFGTAIVIQREIFALTEAEVGTASAALTAGIACGALAGGVLSDRFGRRPVFTTSMVTIMAGSIVLLLAAGFPAILVGGLILGLGVGADLPASLSTIAEGAAATERGKQIGMAQILWSAGILVAVLLGSRFGNTGQTGIHILYGHLALAAPLILVGRLLLPESSVWLAAREATRRQAAHASGKLRSLLGPRYGPLFLTLLFFYAAVNLSANTRGQFGTYLLVAHAGTDIASAAAIGLAFMPLSLLGTLGFISIADGPHRFRYFTAGAVLVVTGNALLALLEFTVATYLIATGISFVGAAFAGEAIVKLWTQESFPTLLRTTAQGGIIAAARFVAAAGASVTPAVASGNIALLFAALTVITAAGLLVAWLTFRRRVGVSEFSPEGRSIDDAEPDPMSR